MFGFDFELKFGVTSQYIFFIERERNFNLHLQFVLDATANQISN